MCDIESYSMRASAMEQKRFDALIARMEKFAAARPAAYRWRVFCFAVAGYAYLVLVVAALLALLIATKLYFIFGVPLIVVLRSMWVRVDPPSGLVLKRREVAELFELLDSLRSELRTPPLHTVILMPDLNAGIAQVPRLGPFGWHRNYLMIGLPLMKALTVEQFRSVLAHEFGHLSRGHARSANWIYRLRLIWQRLDAAFIRRRHWGSGMMRGFLKWYLPRFNATSFPLARANEYEADAAAAQLSSPRTVAQAMTGVSMAGAYLSQRYWPMIQAIARDLPEPTGAPHAGFVAATITELPPHELQQWQSAALATKTSYADTHPSLMERLNAIGARAEFAPPAAGQSADRLLGGQRARLEETLDAQWRQRVAETWKQTHKATQQQRSRLTELRALAAKQPLDVLPSLELAGLEEQLGAGPEAALVMRRSMVSRFPESLPARFALARQQLQGGEPDGVAPMESVIAGDASALLSGSELLRDYYWRRGEQALARQWHERYLERARILNAAKQERTQFNLKDSAVPHGLSPAALASLCSQLRQIPRLSRAYLARKVTQHLPESPMYVLGFRSSQWWMLSSRSRSAAALQRIREKVLFPGAALIINLEVSSARFTSKLRRVEGSRII
jgi:Zn-dependent protease with chaperone function